jgi:hypothetical protein
MKKATRFVLLCGVLAFSAAPVFAGGPGGTDPPPPVQQPTSAATNSTTTGIVATLLAYLGL